MKKLTIIVFLAAVFALSFCCKKEPKYANIAKQTPDLLAQIDGQPLYEKDLDIRTQNSLYENKKQMVDGYVREKLLSGYMTKKGYTDRDTFITKEIKEKVKAPTEKEIKENYKNSKSTQPYDQVKPQIEMSLKNSRMREKFMGLFDELMKGKEIVYYFTRPKVDVTLFPDDIFMGPKDAPITLVEYTDFQCPYCKKSQDTLKEIHQKYGDKVKHIFRYFPIPQHTESRNASNASYCANEQGKFWEYHDIVFARQEEIKAENFTKWAEELKLDKAKFAKCLTDKPYDKLIQRDMDSGKPLGVQSTPTFFINGMVISGAQPFSAFEGIIKSELSNKK